VHKVLLLVGERIRIVLRYARWNGSGLWGTRELEERMLTCT
jgi:hypothetical protein